MIKCCSELIHQEIVTEYIFVDEMQCVPNVMVGVRYYFILLLLLLLLLFDCKCVVNPVAANYTDWATATGRRKLVPTFVDRGMSRGQRGGSPTAVNLSFLDQSRYFLSSISSFILTRADWTPFQTHCYSENIAAPGIDPGTSGLAASVGC
jgi:hypothetical protein